MKYAKLRFHLMTLFTLTLLNCGTGKIHGVFSKGEIVQADFFETIIIDDENDLPFIEVQINGQKAKFLFDTGAPNVISKNFADRLNLKQINKMNVSGSGGHRVKKQAIVRVESIKLGQVEFTNSSAIILDLENSEIFKCLDFDGIIGANLMKLCFWKLDLEDDKLSFSNSLTSLITSSSYDTITFQTNNAGTPKISIEANKHRISNLTFDTGSSHYLSVPIKEASHVLKVSDQKISNYSTGSTSYGIGGRANHDSTKYILLDELKIGTLNFDNSIVSFSENGHRLGNKFLKHYEVVLDWDNKQIYLDKQSDYIYNEINTFGYSTYAENGKLFIGELYNDTDAMAQLKKGDQVMKINDQSFENMTESELCAYLLSRGKNSTNESTIEKITIKRDDQVYEVKLKKRQFIP